MQKTILLLLALFGLCFGQGRLPGFFNATRLSGTFQGSASFGQSTTTALTSFTSIGGQTTSSASSAITINGIAIGLSVVFQVTGASSGYFNVTLNAFTGASFNSFAGVSPSGSASTSFGSGANVNYGFTYYTNLTANTFTLTAAITPTVTINVPLPVLNPNLQAFYAVNTSDGSSSAYSSGGANANGFFGALPSQINYNAAGNVVNNITFTLPPVSFAVISFANVDLTVGVSGSTPAILPVLYNTAARVVASARATYAFSTKFAISLFNTVNTTISTTVTTVANTPVSFSAGTSASVGATGSVNGITYNSQNTVYLGIAYNTTVSTQANLAATLVQNVSGIVIADGKRLVWVFINTTTNTAQVLTDSFYDSNSATVSVNVTHFSTYAVYSAPNTATDTNGNSATGSNTNGNTNSNTNSNTNGNSATGSNNGNTGTGNAGTGGAATLCLGMAVIMAVATFVF